MNASMPKTAPPRNKDVEARITTIGRPLRLEVVLDGPWLERLKVVLRAMEVDGGSYPLQRYLEELIESDIVYRESSGSRGPFVARQEIMHWLHRRHSGPSQRKAAAAVRR